MTARTLPAAGCAPPGFLNYRGADSECCDSGLGITRRVTDFATGRASSQVGARR
jgi:hypothetical protein